MGWTIKFLIFILLIFSSNLISAATEAPTNNYIGSEWRLFNRNVDSFFTNQHYLVDENQSTLSAYANFYSKEGQSLDKQYDLEAKIDLPQTTKKLKLIIEKEKDEVVKATTDENVTTSKNVPSKYSAGASYLLSQSKNFTSLIRFSLRIELPLNPSVKINLHKDIKNDYFDIGLFQKIILYRQEGFQEVSQFSLFKKWNKIFQSDFLNSLVWTAKSDAFALRNNIIVYQNVGHEKALTYSVGANAKLSPKFYYDSYDASASYRQLVYSNYLYGTFTIGADFPKANNFNDEKFVQLRAEVFFQ